MAIIDEGIRPVVVMFIIVMFIVVICILAVGLESLFWARSMRVVRWTKGAGALYPAGSLWSAQSRIEGI